MKKVSFFICIIFRIINLFRTKKLKKSGFIISLIGAAGIGALLPTLLSNSAMDHPQNIHSEVPYCVASPSVPEQVVFDGKIIDLTRYDRRERMDRELSSFTFMHSTTMLLIKRANRYFPIVEPIVY